MDSQKLENVLNLSLDTSALERARSGVLEVGFSPADKTWELIVKYHGDLKGAVPAEVEVEELLAGYAILTVPERLIDVLTTLPEIEYVEKPKSLLYGLYEAKRDSCILPVTQNPVPDRGGRVQTVSKSSTGISVGGSEAAVTEEQAPLSGRGCLLAVFDSGIDYMLPDFQDKDGNSRIVELWDQTIKPDPEKGFNPPDGFALGTVFSREQISAAIKTGNRADAFALVPSEDRSGHGTAVTAIAAGSSSDIRFRGVAPEAALLIVKLGGSGESFPRTTELMRAVTYALNKAANMRMPLAINLSFGNSYGPHDGTSLLERFLDNASEVWKTSICVGAGNEGASGGHVSGRLVNTGGNVPGSLLNVGDGAGASDTAAGAGSAAFNAASSTTQIELVVGEFERTLNIQLWKNFADIFRVTLITPGGRRIPVEVSQTGSFSTAAEGTRILIYTGEPAPYSVNQEIFFDLIPEGSYISSGIWRFELVPEKIISGEYQFYLPGQEVRGPYTRFLVSAPELTLTVPGTASKVITVGASQTAYGAYADFSGRGVPANTYLDSVFQNTKPDLAAPGVAITTHGADGTVQEVTGTSFACPLVTGSAALLMEWGILRGNDIYLYGEKLKAFLRRGAKPIEGESIYPNEKVGYGVLCLRDSLPL